MLILVVFVFRWRTWSCAVAFVWLVVLCPVDSVLTGCRAVGLGVLSVISSGYLSVPRIPQFLGFSHTPRDVFTLPI